MKPIYVVLVVLLAVSAATVCAAQSRGVPASVTSFGFGGNPNAAPGVPAGVTSVGPRGFGSPCCGTRFVTPGAMPHPHDGGTGRGHNNGNNFYGGGYGYIPIYTYGYYPGYSPVIVAQQEEETSADAQETDEAGPTSLEHRGPRRHSAEEAYDRGYEEGKAAAEDSHASREERPARKAAEGSQDKHDQKAAEAPAPAVEVKTVLVYKDGHKEEVANYAIVGDHLFDFTTGRRKVALADLDLPATTKANDERGVDFQLPTVRAKK